MKWRIKASDWILLTSNDGDDLPSPTSSPSFRSLLDSMFYVFSICNVYGISDSSVSIFSWNEKMVSWKITMNLLFTCHHTLQGGIKINKYIIICNSF